MKVYGFRASLLSGASVVALVAYAPDMGHAADLNLVYGPALQFIGTGSDSTATSTADTSDVSLSQNDAAILASIINENMNVSSSPTVRTAFTISDNALQATAIGNSTNTLASISNSNATNGNDLGILTVMVNEPGSSVNSEVLDSEFRKVTNPATDNSVSVSDNTVDATTRLNDVTVNVDVADDASGVTTDSTPGQTLINSGTGTLNTDATIAVATSQLNTDSGDALAIRGSAAQVADTLIEAEVTVAGTAPTPNTSGSFNVEGNDLSAAFTGNRATNNVDSFAETDFTGSVAVANQQLNSYVVDITGTKSALDNAAASVDNTTIQAEFGSGAGDTSVLDGSAIVATNAVEASATGNSATNTLAFKAGVDLTGTGASSANSNMSSFGEPSFTGGDLTLVSQQVNSPFTARAVTSDTSIGVIYEDIDTSSIIVGQYNDDADEKQAGNSVASKAIGNTVSNTISADALSVDATAALVNAQVVGRRATGAAGGEAGSGDVVALTRNTSIGVDATSFAGTTFNGDSVAIDGNNASSSATSSEAVNSLNLAADESLEAGDIYVDLTTLTNLTSDTPSSALRNDGGAILSNFQGAVNSITSATTTDTQIGQTGIFAEYANGSASIDGNTVSASATGLNAFNEANLTGNSVSGSVGLNSVQLHGGQDNGVEGGTSATVTNTRIGDLTMSLAGVDNSGISIDGNAVVSEARASIVTNDLTVSAETGIEFDANAGSVAINLATADDTGTPGNAQYFPSAVMAGGALLANTQITNQDTTATIDTLDIGSNIGSGSISTNLTDSSVTMDGNTVMADAIGNLVASNSPGNHLKVDAGTDLTVEAGGDPGTVVALSNIQDQAAREGDLGALVSADVQSVNIGTRVLGALDGTTSDQGKSSLSVSKNAITGRARGNLTTENRITVTGSDIDLAGDTTSTMAVNALVAADGLVDSQTMSPMDVNIDSEAAVVLTNVQRGSVAGVNTTVGTDGDRATNTDMRIAAWVTGDVTGSTMTVDENNISAIAYDNTGTNRINLGDDNAVEIAANTSLMSQQIAAGPVSAILGQPGSPGTPVTPSSPFSADVVFNGDIFINNTTGEIGSFDTGTTAQITTTDPDEQAVLTAAGFTETSPGSNVFETGSLSTLEALVGGGIVLDTAPGGGFDETGVQVAGTIPGTPATDPTLAIPSIVAEMGGDVIDSAISVSGNETLAAARSNHVTNVQEIKANTITGAGSTNGITIVPGGATDDMTVSVNADYATQNLQTRDQEFVGAGATATAEAYASVGVLSEINDIPDVTGSSLTVDDNAQEAVAEGNVASNTLSLAGTTLGTDGGPRVTSALSSTQTGLAGASSISELDIFAPLAVSESSVSMSGNSSRAETTLNSASNTVSQTATNIYGPVDGLGSVTFDEAANPTYFDIGTLAVSSGASLSNVQAGSGSPATASAELIIHNTDDLSEIDNSYDALVSSAITADGNRADAIVTGNTATNKMTLEGKSGLNVAGALSNIQLNEHSIDANSTLEVDLSLAQVASATTAGIKTSSISATGNINLAQGTGSIARNSVSAESTDLNGPIFPSGAGFALLALDRTPLNRDSTAGVTGTTGLTGFDGSDVAAVGSAVAVNQQFSLAPVNVDANTQLTTTALSHGVAGSSILQENNLTFAEATGNLSGRAVDGSRVTTVSLSGNDVAGSAVALSFQEANDSVAATATTELGVELVGGSLDANGGYSAAGETYGLVSSTISLSGNQTGAYATMNDASTVVSVAGTSIAGAEGNNFVASGTGDIGISGFGTVDFEGDAAVGDHLLLASQMASGTVNATATLDALSVDGSTGLVQLEGDVIGSNLALSNNITEASGAANRAFNDLTLAADTSLGAAGALSNLQTSSANVTSTALIEGGIVNAGELTGTPSGSFPYGLGAASMESSSASVMNNTTVARAHGNTADNVLNASAGTEINTQTTFTGGVANIGAAYTSADGPSVNANAGSALSRADYAMLNVQENSGEIIASANGSFSGILNSGGVSGSALNVGGNVTAANAIGNYASNRLTLSDGVGGSNPPSAAIASVQYNSGNVTARVQGTNGSIGGAFGSFSGHGVLSGNLSRSSVGVTGNSISASATGNSVVNRITRN